MKKLFTLLSTLCLAGTLQAESVYWDFNLSSITPSIGEATTHVTYSGIGVGTVSYRPGTTENALPSVPAGQALQWYDVAQVFSLATFQATNINLEEDTNIKLSFALRSDHVFEVSESIAISYNDGSGWTQKTTLAAPELGVWTIYTVNLPELNNVANAGFRIVTTTTIDVGKYVAIDNVQIVPEPTTTLLLGVGIITLALRRR